MGMSQLHLPFLVYVFAPLRLVRGRAIVSYNVIANATQRGRTLLLKTLPHY